MSKKKVWESIMIADTMTAEEAIDIVDTMYQDRYKVIEEKNKDGITIHVNKIDDVRFTNLEFASVRLLREVQSLQRNLSNSISKQEVKEKFEKIQSLYEKNLKEIDLKEVEKIDRKIFEGIRLEAQRDLVRELLQESEENKNM